MKSESLMRALNSIDDELIEEAKPQPLPIKTAQRHIWLKYGSLAAGLLLFGLIGSGLYALQDDNNIESDDGFDSVVTAGADGSETSNEDLTSTDSQKSSLQSAGMVDIQLNPASGETRVVVEDQGSYIVNAQINSVEQDAEIKLDLDVQQESLLDSDLVLNEEKQTEFALHTGMEYDQFTQTLPQDWQLLTLSAIWTKSDQNLEQSQAYDTLHDYVFEYQDRHQGQWKISMSAIAEPLRDYWFADENDYISTVNQTPMKIYSLSDNWLALFEYNGLNFDIEANNVSIEEFLSVLYSIVK